MISQEEHQEVLERFDRYRNKAVVGYAILALGFGYAIYGNAHSISESQSHGRHTRAAICEVFKEQENERVKQIPLVARLFPTISKAELEHLTAAGLEQSAKERKKLEPSTPANACAAPRPKLPFEEKKHA